ncbi:hypothetical protein Pcinc_001417 [Petrolisthes cinctipes]|uniref:Uncharacterized protein n=1 Tax=Petrolisthes cinctipes TaxID=88211 RepID=A0AAE1GRB2_PETCI|nr:hypothetical protein Pcinc_001417 [Petrolisthes cinctipes]
MDIRVAAHTSVTRRTSQDGTTSRSRPTTAGRTVRHQPPTLTLHLSDYAVVHHGGYHQQTTGGGGQGECVGGDGGVRGRSRRGQGRQRGNFTRDRNGDSARLLPGRPRMPSHRLAGQDEEKQKHRRRLEALSKLNLNTASDLAIQRTPHTSSSLYATQELPQTNNDGNCDLHQGSSFVQPFRLQAPSLRIQEHQREKGTSSNDSSEFKVNRPLTTRELTRKLKKHQSALRRERRRYIAGAERPPARKKASYLEMLENRQEFRRTLVKLLKTEECQTKSGRAQLDRRYHYFITRGLSMRSSPFQKSWVTAILALVPKHLR